MSTRDCLREFEHIVLLAVLRLGREAGVTVRKEIAARTRGEVSIRVVYATFDRLEGKGYLGSHAGDPTPERGGRSKGFFNITGKGAAAMNRTQRALPSMIKCLVFVDRYS